MVSCRVCGGGTKLVAPDIKGYQEGLVYQIFVCTVCDASFVSPNETSDDVYNLLYCHADELVGYERYNRLASLVKQVPRALQALAVTEPAYWSVIETIRQDKRKPSDIKILEIGCGLGYLTYALRKAGYQATGIDISSEAINKAKLLFRDGFKVANLFEINDEMGSYDYVIMMEVIEHVPDPKKFVIAATMLLKNAGKLLVTTPNKSAAPSENNIWQSDMPPVHLWFLPEKSILNICNNSGLACTFVDFTAYTKKFFTFNYLNTLTDLQKSMPRFMKDGSLTAHSRVSKLPSWSVVPRFVASYIRRRLLPKSVSNRSVTMCAIITNK